MHALARIAALGACAGALLGCGDPLADGSYLGDATIRVHAVVQGTVSDARNAAVAVLWLGYSALAEKTLAGADSSVLPITSVDFPPRFTCDLLSPPPGAGAYLAPDGQIVPAFVRVGLLVVFDDVDGNGRVAVGDDGHLLGPDRLLAQSASHALLYVASPPSDARALDAQGAILSDWESASAHYNLVAIDSSPIHGHVVDAGSTVVFIPAQGGVSL
jgi:hypothetical protein